MGTGPNSLAPADKGAIEALRRRLQLPDRFWLYLGGYDYRKNVEFLIRAYAEAKRTRNLPPLVLAGSIPATGSAVTCDVFGAIRKSELGGDDVLTPGVIPSGELADLYRAASLLIYPSLMEGFGLSPAEAIAVGTPVLASSSSSLPEVVRASQCWFDPANPAELVAKILCAAENEEQFSTTLATEFTEAFGIKRYCDLLQKVS